MKEKGTIKKFINFRITDLTAVCEYLEDMEAQGWQLVSMRTLSEFRKVEPRKVRYAAELLDTASAISNVISSDSQEYIDMCEQAGWEFVCNTGKMYIFRTTSETAPQIVTESTEKLADIKRATLKTNLITWVIMPVIMLFNVNMQINANPSIAVIAANYINLISLLIYFMFFLTVSLQVIGFLHWYFKAKRSVAIGQEIPYINLKQLKRRKLETFIPLSFLGSVLLAASIMGFLQGDLLIGAFALILVLFAAAIIVVSHVISKQQLPAVGVIITSVVIGFNLVGLMTFGIVALVISVDMEDNKQVQFGPAYSSSGEIELNDTSMPVSLDDVGIDTSEYELTYNDAYGSKTMLASKFKYRSVYDVTADDRMTLSYDIYYSQFDALRQSYINMLTKDLWVVTFSNPEEWNATEVYKLTHDDYTDYMMVYDNYVVVLHGNNRDDDKSFMRSVAGKFGNVLVNG